MTIDEAMKLARQHRMAGRLNEAAAVYRQVLLQNPNSAEALHPLGGLEMQAGRAAQAVELLTRATRLAPETALYHNDLGMALVRVGKMDQAGACFKRAVELDPRSALAQNNHALILRTQGRLDEAMDALRRAVSLDPNYPEAHYNLGNVLRDRKRPAEAIAAYRRAIEIRPELADAYNNLGTALVDLEQHQEAAAVFRKLLQLRPDSPSAWNNLGSALSESGSLNESLAAINRAIALKPDYVNAHKNRGVILKRLDRPDEAVSAFCRAIELDPGFADALDTLACMMLGQGRFGGLIEVCRSIIARRPESAAALNQLANGLWHSNLLDEALTSCRRALALDPNLSSAHNTLGNIQRDRGQLDDAVASFRRAAELKPEAAGYGGNLAYTVHFHPDYDSARILEVNRQWAERHARPLLPAALAYANDRTPDRRLRIGYVSPDFRQHCASFFLLPLLSNHDPAQVEVICYSGTTQPDDVTAAFKSHAHLWRPCVHMSDVALAERIREDKIDILVDLALHMSSGRLLVFARKPAPVQVTWLGYPSTTGLSMIDYRLTDPYLDPDEAGRDALYAERSIRLPHSFWCYKPTIQTAEANDLPAGRAGQITFGCFNNFVKVTGPTISLWISVMSAHPGSRLMILCPAGSHRDGFRRKFEKAGIAGDRIEFVGRVTMQDYFSLYHRADICLDTIPYPGHTTTLDSLWMGVPVVTLSGQTSCGRGGLSILSNAGLPDLIAHTAEEYVDIVQRLAANLPRLTAMRSTLRRQLSASPLMDGKQFARDVEDAYRRTWRSWLTETGGQRKG